MIRTLRYNNNNNNNNYNNINNTNNNIFSHTILNNDCFNRAHIKFKYKNYICQFNILYCKQINSINLYHHLSMFHIIIIHLESYTIQ